MDPLDKNEVGQNQLSNVVFEKVEKISVWTKFLANLGFCILMILSFLLLDMIISDINHISRYMILVESLLLVFLILLFIPCTFLLKFSNQSSVQLFQKNPDNLIVALRYLNHFVKWLSGIIITFFVFLFSNFIYQVFNH